jgi:hypothetical protein
MTGTIAIMPIKPVDPITHKWQKEDLLNHPGD